MNAEVLNFVGIDLHKKSITICVLNQARQVVKRKKLYCSQTEQIVAFFSQLDTFQAVIEATASYEWLFKLIEPLANRVVLAHPKKLRIIAESTRKSDDLDARMLAEFLALDMIPEAHRPTPRQREHRVLVRHRQHITGQITSVKNKIRRILSDYNADRPVLFSRAGREYLAQVQVGSEDRFVLDLLCGQLDLLRQQLQDIAQRLREFAQSAPATEAEARAVLHTIPGVGTVTVEVVLSEIGDIRRFDSAKKVSAYAGLAPGFRSSAGKSKQLGITKEGSGLLRWALVETAWRMVRVSQRWRAVYDRLRRKAGKKRAIVAVARRLLCVMVAMLKAGQPYSPAMAA